jgi:CRISPR-associated protein Cas5d
LAYFDQAQRRLDRGAFFKPPYLGMREHMAEVEPGTGEAPVAFTLPVGPMVHSYEFDADGNVSKTRFFDAKIINGVMDVPDRGTAQ